MAACNTQIVSGILFSSEIFMTTSIHPCQAGYVEIRPRCVPRGSLVLYSFFRRFPQAIFMVWQMITEALNCTGCKSRTAIRFNRKREPMSQAWRKLRSAVDKLVQKGLQRERLAAAIMELATLRTKDLPLEIRPDFAFVMDKVCFGRIQEQGATIQAMVDAMCEEDVEFVVQSILAMYDTVTRHESGQLHKSPPSQGHGDSLQL
jgi:hypothetical protein